MEILIFCVLCWLCMGVFAVWIAAQKGRPAAEGFLVGFLFGPLGVLVEALLPTVETPRTLSRSSTPSKAIYEDATLTTPSMDEYVDMDVMDALGIQPRKKDKPQTNEEFLRALNIPD